LKEIPVWLTGQEASPMTATLLRVQPNLATGGGLLPRRTKYQTQVISLQAIMVPLAWVVLSTRVKSASAVSYADDDEYGVDV